MFFLIASQLRRSCRGHAAQTRALQTYVKRVYYPFLLRDPEIHMLETVLCALWVHTHPTLSHAPHAHSSLSVAAVVPALAVLPAALAAIEDLIAGSGGALLPREQAS